MIRLAFLTMLLYSKTKKYSERGVPTIVGAPHIYDGTIGRNE